MNTKEDFMLSVGDNKKLIGILKGVGFDKKHLERLVASRNNSLAPRMMKIVKNMVTQKEAKAIMDENFLGAEEATKFFDIEFVPKEMNFISEIPFSESLLKRLKENYILVLVPQISISEIHKKTGLLFYFGEKSPWYSNEPFYNNQGDLNWQLFPKTIITKDKWQKNWIKRRVITIEKFALPEIRDAV